MVPPEQQPVQSLAPVPVEQPLGVQRHAGAVVVAVVVEVAEVVVTEEVQEDEAMAEQVYTWVANMHLAVQVASQGWPAHAAEHRCWLSSPHRINLKRLSSYIICDKLMLEGNLSSAAAILSSSGVRSTSTEETAARARPKMKMTLNAMTSVKG